MAYSMAILTLRGEGFTIIEVNGAGSEATHIWDSDMSLAAAYRTLRAQLRLAFAIGATNRARAPGSGKSGLPAITR